MSTAVDLGRKARKQTNKHNESYVAVSFLDDVLFLLNDICFFIMFCFVNKFILDNVPFLIYHMLS